MCSRHAAVDMSQELMGQRRHHAQRAPPGAAEKAICTCAPFVDR